MAIDRRFPDLGLFFGDQGGPGTSLPQTDAQRSCPFLDPHAGEFCSLDGAMCPFVGFNYRKCKKYTNNVARGALSAQGIEPSVRIKQGKPPRLEALTEGKKGGSNDDTDSWEALAHVSPDFAARSAQAKEDLTKIKKPATKKPATKKPATKKPATKKPATKKPATKKPATPNASAKDMEVLNSLFDQVAQHLDTNNVPTATGRKEAEFLATELERERFALGPDTPEVIKKVREMSKARGDSALDQKDIDYNAAQRSLMLAYANGPGGIRVDGGTYHKRVAAINAVFDMQNERIKRALTHPTQGGHDLRTIANFGVGGLLSTDDDGMTDVVGHVYPNGEVGASVSADANEKPETGPWRSYSGRFTGREIRPDKEAMMKGRQWRVQQQKLAMDLRKNNQARRNKVFSLNKNKDKTRPDVPTHVDTLGDFDGIPDDLPNPADIAAAFENPFDPKPPAPAAKPAAGKMGRLGNISVKHLNVGDRPKFRTTSSRRGKRRHSSGLPQTNTKTRRPEQLEAYFRSLTRHQHELIFRGRKASGFTGATQAIEFAKKLYATNNTSDIEKMHQFFQQRLEAAQKAEADSIKHDRDFKEAIRQSQDAGTITDKQIMQLGRDPKQLDKVVKYQNTLLDNLFTMKTKQLKIGNTQVTQFLKDCTLPVMERSDFEAIRMSEQMSMLAIQKQHQYGRKYGQFNTLNLFIQQVLLPFVMAFLPLDGDAKGHLMKAVQRMYPREFLNSMYFSFIENPLPKYKGSDSPVPSKDTKFETSQKMGQPGRADTIMKGFYNDTQGVYLPPDRAVLHSRAYPTTKTTWGKTRKKAYTQRYQAAQANDGADWKRGFLRR